MKRSHSKSFRFYKRKSQWTDIIAKYVFGDVTNQHRWLKMEPIKTLKEKSKRRRKTRSKFSSNSSAVKGDHVGSGSSVAASEKNDCTISPCSANLGAANICCLGDLTF